MTYARHELEHTCLCLIEQDSNFVQAGDHLSVFTNSASHTASQGIAQVVVDVEFARGSWCEERIVQTWKFVREGNNS